MSRWKIFLTTAFIGTYLSALAWGIFAHAMKVGLCGNTLSYYVVWDMFCGWTAWDSRTHIIAEGESGQFYDVEEPWGEFHPFGHVGRIHYDYTNHLLNRHLANVIRQTKHEPFSKVYVVEELWPKQYNLPPELYANYFGRPNDKLSYYHLRAICQDDGSPLKIYPDWHAQQTLNAVANNPRLRQQAHAATGLYSTLYTPSGSQTGSNLNTSIPLTTN